MLFNYIKIAFRNIVRLKIYSIINILGLAVGMTCTILLLLLIWDELTYDRHNSKYDRIYIVQTHTNIGGEEDFASVTPLPLAQALKDEYPTIEESIRLTPSNGVSFIDQRGETIREDNISYADPGIFNVFDYKFIYGSPDGALDAPNTIVISESFSKKYFGEQYPVGKIISKKNGTNYIVKGVYEDVPGNSSNHYDALITSQNLSENYRSEQYTRFSKAFTLIVTKTYVLLAENAEVSSITEDYKRFNEKYLTVVAINDGFRFVFKSLADDYLHSELYHNSPVSVLQRGYILSALALFILIIACINYMNLATARSVGRGREVGVRKVLGANRISIIRQFLCESIIITTTAVLIALVLIELTLPSFNNLVGKQLSFSAFAEMGLFSGMLLLTLVVGLIAGSYPAFVLSSYLPVKVRRGGIQSSTDKGKLRKILVITQYSISVIMIICTILLTRQMNYIRNIDLGFNKHNVFFIVPGNTGNKGEINTIQAFKEKLLKYSGISSVATSTLAPVTRYLITLCQIEDSSGNMIKKKVAVLEADYDYINLMEMKILKGRNFSREMMSDRNGAIIVNETLVKEMGWNDSPIGKQIVDGRVPYAKNRKVIGVLKDFHLRSLHNKIEPTIVTLYEESSDDMLNTPFVSIKINPIDTGKTIEFIREKWHELNPMSPIEIYSIEDIIDFEYKTDEAASRIFIRSAFLGIFISCLGLFGLSSFIAENKTKEIGVRKVFGASVSSILYKLSFNFLALVLIASIIAWPIAFYVIDKWLENFAYKTELSWGVFVGAACIAMAIALATVSYHAVKAALTDPVKALRYE